jgi:pilus assembly protein CpaB
MPSPAPRPPPHHGWHRWRRRLRRHRRGGTAALAALCLICSLEAAAPARPVTVDVLVAAHDLSGGIPLSAGDLALARLPPSAAPAGALRLATDAVGRTLAAPVRRGEPLTDVRLVGPRLVDALGPGLVATPVRLADPAVAALLRPGDRVDVLAAPADPALGARTTLAAADVPVLAVPAGDPASDQGALVVLATTSRVAVTLAAAATGQRLSVTLRGG